MIVIAFLLRNLQAVKDLVRLLFKKHCFGNPLRVDMLEGPKPL